jgi:glycosyltransferase involved in cell wall biosynthesis
MPREKVIAVGRLSAEKGFDLLLEAFAGLAPRFNGWVLEIWGEGPLRMELEGYRDSLGLKDRVHFRGLTEDIHRQYTQSDIFVLSSRFEGFPNALCEAMSNGLAVVATSCSGGVRNIVRSGVDGLLVPPGDSRALGGAMAELMVNPGLREALGAQAKSIVERFSVDSVLDAWESCLFNAQNNP